MQSPAPADGQWMTQLQQQELKTLWVGDLQPWMDEGYLNSIFSACGELVSAKVIRSKLTGNPEGYGFVEFASHSCADRVLQTFSGTQMPQSETYFRLNWAYFGIGDRRPEGGPENSIFVGDLAPDVTDFVLQETFRSRYPSVRGAKVVTDPVTSRSKGYGFVRFGDESERIRAMTEMNGAYCSSRPMRINAATPKKATSVPLAMPQKPSACPTHLQNVPSDNDPGNTTIFVGGLDPAVTEEELRKTFDEFGELIYVKIPPGKGCGFVQFTHRACAEEALSRLHGAIIGQQPIRLSWGRMASKQPWGQATDQQWTNYYGYGYEGYNSYPPAAQEGYSYGNYQAAYPAYPGYTNADGYTVPMYDPSAEIFDPAAPPDIDRLNAIHIAAYEPLFVGRHLSLVRCSEQAQAA